MIHWPFLFVRTTKNLNWHQEKLVKYYLSSGIVCEGTPLVQSSFFN